MGEGHAHDVAGSNRARLGIALAITSTVLIAEVVGALVTGSLALLVDAGHMLTDAGGLLMALLAATAMTRPPTDRRTWGWARIEILAAGAQAAVLLAVGIYAFVEGVQRLIAPPEVAAGGLLLLGILGLVANIASVVVLSAGRGHNPRSSAFPVPRNLSSASGSRGSGSSARSVTFDPSGRMPELAMAEGTRLTGLAQPPRSGVSMRWGTDSARHLSAAPNFPRSYRQRATCPVARRQPMTSRSSTSETGRGSVMVPPKVQSGSWLLKARNFHCPLSRSWISLPT